MVAATNVDKCYCGKTTVWSFEFGVICNLVFTLWVLKWIFSLVTHGLWFYNDGDHDLFQSSKKMVGFKHNYATGYVKCCLHGSDLWAIVEFCKSMLSITPAIICSQDLLWSIIVVVKHIYCPELKLTHLDSFVIFIKGEKTRPMIICSIFLILSHN